jgi:hypothetical protein
MDICVTDATWKEHEDTPAPPAIVPKRYGLISITFFTVPDAVQRISINHPNAISELPM